MTEAAIQKMLDKMKEELKNDIKRTEGNMKTNMKEELKNTEQSIKKDIAELKVEGENNKEEIKDLKKRVEEIEKKGRSYADVAKTPPSTHTNEYNAEKKNKTEDEKIKETLSLARCKVGISPITLEDIFRTGKVGKTGEESAVMAAAKEFLKLELKMDDEEIENLGQMEATRKEVDENEKVYLTFKSEENAEYIMRKAQICRNHEIKVFPFIPPQFFQRFNDLSRNTFLARKQYSNLKTKIQLGEKDLILRTKIKDETSWEREHDLEVFGKISNPDMEKKWPATEVKYITSPPKGRVRKNVHNISNNSEKESPEAKRKKTDMDTDQDMELTDEENTVKVQAFIKKLEAKKVKYTQQKIQFDKK